MSIDFKHILCVRSLTAVLLLALLPAALCAEDAPALKVVVIAGAGGINHVESRLSAPTVVEVRDDRDQPVDGAEVRFLLPETGPGGRFEDGSRAKEAFTDPHGRVILTGFVPNQIEGPFEIAVNAHWEGRDANRLIEQSNRAAGGSTQSVRPKRWSTSTQLLMIVAIGAAVAAGSMLAMKSGGSGSASAGAAGTSGASGAASAVATSVSIGSISIGAPQK